MLGALHCDSIPLRGGVQLPIFGFGTYELRGLDCERGVEAALRLGYRHIDTAAVYQNGAEVARGIARSGVPRSDIFITSKLSPSDHGAKSYDACLSQLKAVNTEYFDLFLIHWPGVRGIHANDSRVQDMRRDSWLALQRLQAEGKCKAIGVSNYTEKHLEELCTAPWCTALPAVNQIELHPFLRQRDIVESCARFNISIVAYASLARGAPQLLTAPAVTEPARARGATPAQVCLRWAMQHGWAVIPKSASKARIAENAGALTISVLTDDEMAVLDSNMLCEPNAAEVRTCWNPYTVER